MVTHDGDDFKNTPEKLQISGHVGLEVLQTAFVIAQVIPSISLDDSPATTYDPPANFADITVSLQVFRI